MLARRILNLFKNIQKEMTCSPAFSHLDLRTVRHPRHRGNQDTEQPRYWAYTSNPPGILQRTRYARHAAHPHILHKQFPSEAGIPKRCFRRFSTECKFRRHQRFYERGHTRCWVWRAPKAFIFSVWRSRRLFWQCFAWSATACWFSPTTARNPMNCVQN